MKTRLLLAILLATLTFLSFPVRTLADTFGSGANSFEIEFVTIGNPGNAATLLNNPTAFGPFGAVSDTYRIGKFEISEQYCPVKSRIAAIGYVRGCRCFGVWESKVAELRAFSRRG